MPRKKKLTTLEIASKIQYEGGIEGGLEYGLEPDTFKDIELMGLWTALMVHYDKVKNYLEPYFEELDFVEENSEDRSCE